MVYLVRIKISVIDHAWKLPSRCQDSSKTSATSENLLADIILHEWTSWRDNGVERNLPGEPVPQGSVAHHLISQVSYPEELPHNGVAKLLIVDPSPLRAPMILKRNLEVILC